MVQKVTKWEANDGKLFDSADEAKEYERQKAGKESIEAILKQYSYHGEMNIQTLLDLLTDEDDEAGLVSAILTFHQES